MLLIFYTDIYWCQSPYYYLSVMILNNFNYKPFFRLQIVGLPPYHEHSCVCVISHLYSSLTLTMLVSSKVTFSPPPITNQFTVAIYKHVNPIIVKGLSGAYSKCNSL